MECGNNFLITSDYELGPEYNVATIECASIKIFTQINKLRERWSTVSIAVLRDIITEESVTDQHFTDRPVLLFWNFVPVIIGRNTYNGQCLGGSQSRTILRVTLKWVRLHEANVHLCRGRSPTSRGSQFGPRPWLAVVIIVLHLWLP